MSLSEFYRDFFPTVWLVWLIIWFVFARNVKATVRRQAALPRLLDLALLLCAGALLWPEAIVIPALAQHFLPGAEWPYWAALGAVLLLVGLLFSVWARVYLGRNWSGVVTVKADHELVTRGPYGLVRHPIYSGLTLGFLGTALAIEQWRGVLAVVLALIAFIQRIIVEERFMREQFGAAYDAYAERVRALVPGVI